MSDSCKVVFDIDNVGLTEQTELLPPESSVLTAPERTTPNGGVATFGEYGNKMTDGSGGKLDRRASIGHIGVRPPSGSELGPKSNSKSVDYGLDRLKRLANGKPQSEDSEHRIKLEEVAPCHSAFYEDERTGDWRMPLQIFSSKKHGQEDKSLPRSLRRYYKTQDELITAFEELQVNANEEVDNSEAQKILKSAALMSRITFFCNLALLCGKAAAAAMTGSLAVISSLIDSAVDLLSGTLFWWSSRAIKKRDLYRYPQGRTRLEPVAIVILSVVMSLASVQMIRESVEKIISYATDPETSGPVFNIPSIILCVLTIGTKLILFLVCRRIQNPSVQALAQDHRNDVLSNTVALGCGFIAFKWWAYLDPIGAIIISLYIIGNWIVTGKKQIKMLTGHTARPDFLKKITWIALNHHEKVLLIDTVRAFHFGSNFLVEVDIVLPEEMTHREAHDIGASLQLKLERLSDVERAFVHLDYESEHSPWSEHKVV